MRLIDADALIESIAQCKGKNSIYAQFVRAYTKDAPTIDAVPVVRCKDCVHGTDRTEEFGDGCINPIDCLMYSNDGEPDFFPKDNYCGFGERKDDKTGKPLDECGAEYAHRNTFSQYKEQLLYEVATGMGWHEDCGFGERKDDE